MKNFKIEVSDFWQGFLLSPMYDRLMNERAIYWGYWVISWEVNTK